MLCPPRVSEGEAWRVARRGGYVVRWGWYVVPTWEHASVEHGNHGRPHTPDTPGGECIEIPSTIFFLTKRGDG